jgi:sec-independent protein translocase protein TatA
MIGDILQPTHLLFVLVVALLVLGPKRLPEASRAIGKGIRDFRMAVTGEEPDHGALSTPSMPTGVTAPYAPVATPTPPPSEATLPTFAADAAVIAPEGADTVAPAVTAPEGADTVASTPEAAPTSQPTEPAQPVG